MNQKSNRKNCIQRILAIILSLLMLLQTFSVFAEDIEIPENTPAETAATVSEDAEKAVGAEVPAEGDGTAAEEAAGEDGVTAEGSTEVPKQEAEAPAAEPVFDISESVTMTEAGYIPAPPYFEGTLVHEGADYTVTAVIGLDAKFPEDVQMRVEEILPGTEQYELYTQLMEETLEEGEELGEFARYFDISFIADIDGAETEIEPQADIDVQITFQETIALTEESDVQAVHIAENTPEILETITDSLEAAVNDDEAIDTVTFSADSFSIYGVVQKIKKILKVITASGETFTVDVTYTSDANIPEDAELIATEITPNDPNYDIYREQTALALGADDVRLPGLFDLGIYVNGEKIQPEAPVSVAISLNEGIQEGEKLYVVHFPEGIEAAQESVEEAPKLMVAPRMMRAAAPMKQPDAEQQATEQLDGETPVQETINETPAVATEVSEATVEGETVTFEANGFSVYALAYTIEVYYKTADGETYLITLNYSENAGIPENAELAVREILPGDAGYGNYFAEAVASAKADAVSRGMDVPVIAGARVFDIEILADGEKIEPAEPVKVSIRLVGEAAEMLSVIHFAEDGTEIIQLKDSSASEEAMTVIFDAESFSVYTVVGANDIQGDTGYALVSGIAGDPGATTGYGESWGQDYFTIIVNGMAVTDSASNNQLGAMSVHAWQEGSNGFVGGDATEWYFVRNGNGYRIRNRNGQYIRHSGENSNNGDIELTGDWNSATTFTLTATNDGTGTYYLKNGNNWYLCNKGSNEWSNTYFQMDYQGNTPGGSAYKFKLCEKSDNYDSFAAEKKGMSNLVPDDSFLIYRKFVDTNGNEALYALAHDGTFVRVYDGGDYIYWRETDKNLYWNYQLADDGGYNIFTHAPGSETKIYINPVASAGQIFSETPGKLSLSGMDNNEFSSAIEQWDQTAYDYAGLHVSVNSSTGDATLSVGKRTETTSDQFLFAVARSMPAGQEETVGTVDSEALGIHITMFDYGSATTEYEAGAKLHSMSTVIDGNGENNHSTVEGFHPHSTTQLVRPYLQDGVPVSSLTGRTMAGLFTSGGSAVTNSVSGVTNLFLQTYYDENGMFRYRSEDNYAYLAPGSTNFKVYRQAATPYTTDLSVGRSYYFHGHFMPFNDIDYSNHLSRLMNQYGNAYENGTAVGELPVGDGRTYEDIYGVQGTPNYFTGMKMEAKFSQPRDGKVKSGDDMIFKFTGDDDMWVYIDDVLILDIGGIHEPLSGTINFATGVVTNPNGSSLAGQKTLYQIFMDVRNNSNTPQAVKDKIDAIEWKDADGNGTLDTFADYTNHSFSAFYMERGAGASNLDIQFNLKVTLVDEFSVKKELPENIDPRFDNEEYKFQVIYRDDSENDAEKPLFPGALKSDGTQVCVKVVYKDKKDAQGHEIAVPVDENGYFYLRAGEEAVFKMVDESTYYCVKEYIDSETNNGAEINNGDIILSGTADSGFDRVHNRGELHFKNYPITQNLEITKHITEDSADWEGDNPVFEFRVFLESEVVDNTVNPPAKVQKLVPYSQGPYYLKKDGKYYTLTGENNAPVEVSPNPTVPTICSYTGYSGSINSIPPEYTVVIPNLTVGTHFYIEERLDNIPKGYEYVYEELTDGTYDIETMYMGALNNNNVQSILARNTDDTQVFDPTTIGKIKKGTDAESHIYNRKPKKDITIKVEKLWNGIEKNNPILTGAEIKVTIGRYVKTEKSGNFRIVKTVTPEDAEMISKYTISGTDASGASRTFGPYVIYGSGEATGTLPPGNYTVTEAIVSEDDSYSWTHSAHTASLDIADGQDGTPTPVSFNSTGTVKTGSLKVTSSMDPGGSSMNFAQVYYTVLDKNGNRAKDVDGNDIADIYFPSHEAANTGTVIGNLKTGQYTIVEKNVPPTPEGYVMYSHTPPGTDRMTVTVTENNTTTAAFSTVYRSAYVTNTFRVHKRYNNNWQNDSQGGSNALDRSGSFTAKPGDSVLFVLYMTNAGWNRFNDNSGFAQYDGANIDHWYQADNSNGRAIYYFRIPEIKENGFLEIGMNAQENAWLNWEIQVENSGGRSLETAQSGTRKLSANRLRGANTTATVEPATYGTAPSDDDLYKYVDDASYNETVTLTAGNGWAQSFTARPVQEVDGEGVSYTYYYYIKHVEETGMPEGTTCTVKLNGENTFLVSEDKLGDSLSVTNTVPKGSMDVTKTVESTSPGPRDPRLDEEHTYNVTITTTINNVTYYVQNTSGELATSQPSPSLKVSNKSTLHISNLPYGSYTVTETSPTTDVTIASFSYVTTEGSVESGTTTVGATPASFELKNYYSKGASWTPEATKRLNGQPYTGAEYSFILTETTETTHHPRPPYTETKSTTNGKAVFREIEYHNPDLHGNEDPIFTYTIREVLPNGVTAENPISDYIQYDTKTVYIRVVVNKHGHNQSAVVTYYSDPAYQTPAGTAVFDNTELGTLTVTKTVTGSYTPSNEDTYPITVKKGNEFVTATKNGTIYTYTGLSDTDPLYKVKAGETLTFINMPVGEYTVTEGDAEKTGYVHTTIYSVNDAVTQTANATITKGNTTTVGITNHYRDAELVIRKTINGVETDDIGRIADSITITLTDGTHTILNGVKLTVSPFTASDNVDNVYIATLKSTDEEDYAQYIVPDGTYTVTETISAADGYELISSTYQVTARENVDSGTAAVSGTGYSLQLTNTDTSSGEIDFTNTYRETVDIDVTKSWADAEHLPQNTSITVELSAKVGTDTYELNRTDRVQTISASTTPTAWKYTWEDLPKKTDNGDLITYEVTETGITVAGTAVAETDIGSYQITPDTENTDYNFFLKNQIPRLTRKALKQWSQNKLPANTSVTLRITATVGTSTEDIFSMLTDVTGDQEQTLSGTDATVAEDWTAEWSNLPKYYLGNEITYSISETAITVDGTEVWTSESEGVNPLITGVSWDENYDAIFMNKLPVVEVKADKRWLNADGDEVNPADTTEAETVTFGVFAGSSTEPITTVALNGTSAEEPDGSMLTEPYGYASDAWEATFKNLPKYDENGAEVVYTVKETMGYENYVNLDPNGVSNGGTIRNKKPEADIDISGTKAMKGGEAPEKGAYTFTITGSENNAPLPDPTEVSNTEEEGAGFKFNTITYTLSDWQNGTPVEGEGHENERTFTYTITETEGEDSNITYDSTVYTVLVTLTYDEESASLSATKTITAPVDKTAIEFVNEEILVNLNILKVDADGMTKPLSGAEFTIQQFDESSSEMTAIGSPSTATTGDNGIAEFEDLKAGYYIVTETKLPAGYIPNGNGSFYIKVDGGEVKLVEKGESGWTESSGNAKLTFTAANGENPATVTVGNDAGSELPNTGGIGTTPFTLLGLFLITMAGTILLLKKRKA